MDTVPNGNKIGLVEQFDTERLTMSTNHIKTFIDPPPKEKTRIGKINFTKRRGSIIITEIGHSSSFLISKQKPRFIRNSCQIHLTTQHIRVIKYIVQD